MAHDRNRFKENQMPTLRTFLNANSIEFRDGKGANQLLQINVPGAGWQALCVSGAGIVTSPPALRQVASEFQHWLTFVNTVPSKKTPHPQKSEEAFKNFHRSLCERFGAVHDPVDWWRDTVSLEEYIAGLIAKPAPTPQFLDDLRDDFAMRILPSLIVTNPHKLPLLDLTNQAYCIADLMLYSRGHAKREAQRRAQ